MVRGRKANLDLPLTPALIQQREFREKRANQIKSLKDENAQLSTQNAELQKQNEQLQAQLKDMRLRVDWQEKEIWLMARALQDVQSREDHRDEAGVVGDVRAEEATMMGQRTRRGPGSGVRSQQEEERPGAAGRGRGASFQNARFGRSDVEDASRECQTARVGIESVVSAMDGDMTDTVVKGYCGRQALPGSTRPESHSSTKGRESIHGLQRESAVLPDQNVPAQRPSISRDHCVPETYRQSDYSPFPPDGQTLYGPRGQPIPMRPHIDPARTIKGPTSSRKRSRSGTSPTPSMTPRAYTPNDWDHSATLPDVMPGNSTSLSKVSIDGLILTRRQGLVESEHAKPSHGFHLPSPPISSSRTSNSEKTSTSPFVWSATKLAPPSPILTSDLRLPFKEDVCCMGLVSCEPDSYPDV